MCKRILFIVDPQNDFIEGGNLPVQGGKKAMDNLLESGILDEPWDNIFVTLDSHTPTNLGFTDQWEGDLKIGEIVPAEAKNANRLLGEIYKNTPHQTAWLAHCITGTIGWEIYGPLLEKLMSKEGVVYIMKGQDDTREAYSAFTYGDGRENEDNLRKLGDLGLSEECVIYFCGLAEDYCVLETIKSMLKFQKYSPGGLFGTHREWEYILLKDYTAAINTPETVKKLYEPLLDKLQIK